MENSYITKNIITEINENGERTWKFKDTDLVPIFRIDLQNNLENKGARDTSGIIDVTTENFKINLLNNEAEISPSVFFTKDYFTNEPVLINKLKSNMSNNLSGEEMKINCTPKIGLGKHNSRNDPTGTVKYSFKLDSDRVEEVFSKKLEYLQKERERKGLNRYNQAEIEKIRNSFNLLDKDRVYEKNENGDPTHFHFSVESIDLCLLLKLYLIQLTT